MSAKANPSCQSIYRADGTCVFPGEWDARPIFQALSPDGEDYWRGRRVLDLGANTSGLSVEIARRGARVVAAEPDPYKRFQARVIDIIDKLIIDERLDLRLNNASLFEAHTLGEFDDVLCLGLIYHFRNPQYILDYLSTVEHRNLFISTHTHAGEGLMMINRKDPESKIRPGLIAEETVLTGWHPTRPLFEAMLRWAGYDDVRPLTDSTLNFPHKLPGFTNTSYYRATRINAVEPLTAMQTYYPR